VRILNFLFGRDPDIFDEKGNVRHVFGEKKWKDWDARFRDKSHDWRHAKGRGQSTPADAEPVPKGSGKPD
jgi:hypothetical protein